MHGGGGGVMEISTKHGRRVLLAPFKKVSTRGVSIL